MADLEYDVRKKQELTEAQILAGGVKPGQSWQSSDSSERIMRSVDGNTYRKDKVGSENVTIFSPADESFTGTATTQSEANISHVNVQKINSTAISVNTQAIAESASASGSIDWGPQGVIPSTPTKATFTVASGSNNTSVLDFDDTNDYINFKRSNARYLYVTSLVVMTKSGSDKVITLTTKRVADDVTVITRDVPVEGGNNKVRHINVPVGIIDNTVADNEVYVEVTCNDSNAELLGGTTTITASGAGTIPLGLEDVIANDPVATSVPDFQGGLKSSYTLTGDEVTLESLNGLIVNRDGNRLDVNYEGITKVAQSGTSTKNLIVRNADASFPDIDILSLYGKVSINNPHTTQKAQENYNAMVASEFALASAGGLADFIPYLFPQIDTRKTIRPSISAGSYWVTIGLASTAELVEVAISAIAENGSGFEAVKKTMIRLVSSTPSEDVILDYQPYPANSSIGSATAVSSTALRIPFVTTGNLYLGVMVNSLVGVVSISVTPQ